MDLSKLNSRQREAVTSTEGRIRVIAGAGSGKTRALAFRYAYIVNELGIDPANILLHIPEHVRSAGDVEIVHL